MKISNKNFPLNQINRFDPHILNVVGKTISDYKLIQPGDSILVGISGGKDSWSLLYILLHFKKVSPVNFQLLPVTINPGFENFDTGTIQKHLNNLDLNYLIVDTNISDTINKRNTKGKNPCAFCARLRRGALYRIAEENNCNKIALGHHADDAIETLLLSAFFEGRLSSMPPSLNVKAKPITLIRPLIRVWETDLKTLFGTLQISQVDCPFINSTESNQRQNIKNLLNSLSKKHPGLKTNLLVSLQNIRPSRFLDKQWL